MLVRAGHLIMIGLVALSSCLECEGLGTLASFVGRLM
jgi:hypothetical protein